LHKVSDEVLSSVANAFTNNVTAISNEIVSRRCAFKVSRPIADHNNLQLIVTLQLTRVEIPNLSDRLALSTASAGRLVHVKGAIITIEVKQKFVGEEIIYGNAELSSNRVDKRMEPSRDQINFFCSPPLSIR